MVHDLSLAGRPGPCWACGHGLVHGVHKVLQLTRQHLGHERIQLRIALNRGLPRPRLCIAGADAAGLVQRRPGLG